jgi:hydrogenase maturation factor
MSCKNSSVWECILEVNADDYVLAHFRFALCKLDEEEAAAGREFTGCYRMDRLAELEVAQIELRREDSYEISR